MFKFVLALSCIAAVCATVEFEFHNTEDTAVYVRIQENPGQLQLENGGFRLEADEKRSVQAPETWAGHFLGRTDCLEHCVTYLPSTWAEITLQAFQGLDYYDVSIVDGFNIGLTVNPVEGSGENCVLAGCSANVLASCPEELQDVDAEGKVITCESACARFNTDKYCCRGEFSTPEKCDPSTWPVNYVAFFKENCPDTYAWAYDDDRATFSCAAKKYEIKFGQAKDL